MLLLYHIIFKCILSKSQANRLDKNKNAHILLCCYPEKLSSWVVTCFSCFLHQAGYLREVILKVLNLILLFQSYWDNGACYLRLAICIFMLVLSINANYPIQQTKAGSLTNSNSHEHWLERELNDCIFFVTHFPTCDIMLHKDGVWRCSLVYDILKSEPAQCNFFL